MSEQIFMNRLILLGNGFDLAHGLKTSYNDFIKWYFKKCLMASSFRPYEDPLIIVQKMDYYFGLGIPNQLDDYIDILYHVGFENCVQKEFVETGVSDDFVNPYRIVIKSQLLERLFARCSYSSWVEVENEFYQLLKQVFIEGGSDRNKKIKDLNDSLSVIIKELEAYLLTQQIETLNDSYLDIFNSKILKSDVVTKLMTDIYPDQTMILNFNYTSTVERYIDSVNDKHTYTKPNYIHGELASDRNPMIFGFGDEHDEFYQKMELEKDKSSLKYIKSFWYSKTGNYHDLLRFIERDKYQIVIMGHSCGLSDRTMLNMLFEHANCASIKIYYYDNGKGYNNHEDLTYEISQHFKDKLKMRRVIVPKSKSSAMPQVDMSKIGVASKDADIDLN